MLRNKKSESIEAEKFEMICKETEVVKKLGISCEVVRLCKSIRISDDADVILVPDYDDESGVYLGPGRAFDDEDLDYLNKDVDDQAEEKKKQKKKMSPPSSPLKVDSVSGIYLGFDEPAEDDEDDEKTVKNDEDDTSDDSSEAAAAAASNAHTTSIDQLWKRFRVKQSSKYKVNDEEAGDEGLEAAVDGSNCFKFISKMWKKAEVCQ